MNREPAARGAARRVAHALVFVALGCSVDERTLLTRAGIDGAGGSGSAAGATGNPSLLPQAGVEDPPAPLPRCIYSSTTAEPGCETLVKNPGFTKGWLNVDASDDPHSGSLEVMNLNYKEDVEAIGGTNGGGARQCVPVTAGTAYDLTADVFIPKGQGAGFEGDYVSVATLSVFYYEGADCGGRTLSNFTSTPVDQTDEWVHVEGSTTAPKESASMAVRLATLKPFRQLMFKAHFDNVLVREHAAP